MSGRTSRRKGNRMRRAYYDGGWHDVDLIDVNLDKDGNAVSFKLRENGEVLTIAASDLEAWW